MGYPPLRDDYFAQAPDNGSLFSDVVPSAGHTPKPPAYLTQRWFFRYSTWDARMSLFLKHTHINITQIKIQYSFISSRRNILEVSVVVLPVFFVLDYSR